MNTKQAIFVTLGSLAALYVADDLVSRFRPQGSIQVEVFYSVVRKDNRIDYIRADPKMETCVNSLGPHMGMRPCWYVAKHPQQEINVGKAHDDFWRF